MKTTLFLRHLLLFGLILIQFPSCLESLDADEDPYKILGVPRSASNDDIKKAYKKMARNWHPDKNDDPEAQEMFIKINEAHEILSDKEKKQHFDLYGTTTQPRNGQKQGSPFFDPHSGFSFFFNGMPFQNSWSTPGQIDYRTYYKTILPMSSEKPYLIKFIADWCFACAQIEEIWEDTTHGMKKNGMGIGIVNINSSPRLADALGIRHVPSIIGVINGYISFYSGSVTKQRLKDFVTGLFPGGLIQMVTKQNLDSFLDTSGTNKPGASELKSGKLREVVESHKYLYLPRLSSRSLFHDLCPEERFRSQRRLCVVLFTKQGQHEKEKLILRLLAKDKKYQNEKRIQFLYLYEDVQKEFIINGFKDGMKEDTCADNSTAPKVVIIWNKGKKEIRYDWLRTGWCVSDGELSLTKARLVVMLNDLLSGEGKLRYTSRLPFIHNEHAPGLLSLLLTWCNDAFYYVRSSMYRKEAISLVSLLFGLGIILFFNAFVPSASESLDRVHKTSKKSHSPPPQSNTVLGVVRLDPSNEHSLVSEAPPGHMTFALLVDEESVQEAVNSPLIQAFSDVVNPYKGSNPNLTFAWLTISDNLAWCSEVMSVDKFGEVTPGIVLALNGHKKYLSIFKPSDLTKSAFFKRQGGDLMGFDNSDSETESISDPQREYELKRQKVLSISLRRQFVIWLEKLLDGLVDRTKIEEWPRFTD
ncbi:dnaJ homolog subfamily C member 16-like isoform X3 [Montipora foliosa]|uniref:dnaJ homolog subfamily C member 16-like isoform X3 n=1 Tax=Montipora foliosa TaxID=591990 RepID=UPI0035F1FA3C